MKTKHNLIENKEAIKQAFVKLAECKLNLKEKQTLLFISNNKTKLPISILVKRLCVNLNCSDSTAWSVIRFLRKLILIHSDKGILELTPEGRLLVGGKND